MPTDNKQRCAWCQNDPLYQQYHDSEWGVPVWDDQKQYEFLVLESAQAGLSWLTILKKRENYRAAFADFDFEKVAKFDEDKIEQLLSNPGIIRNRRKIEAAINNAKIFIKLRQEFGSFSNYLWQFVEHKPLVNHWQELTDVPAQSDLSREISADLKKRGCKFIGPTIIYSHLQATGLINDHLIGCYRWQECQEIAPHT
ncbi:MAG: DNA-3-methyladenine glycosylase I [Candidatus Cloacimonadales bacterium]